MIPDLTDQGKNLLLRALTGDRITFTRMEFGNGTAQDIKTATGLMNPLLSANVSKISQDGDYVAVTATFSNKDLSDGFRITEIGVYALDPDDDTKEILYVLGNEDASAADYVPNNTQRVFDMEQSVLVYIGSAQDVTAAINSSLVFASAADLKEHTENTSNPHNVSKENVGLGNVPNVSTNDQTPTYETAASLQALKPGEKLSTAFGKIKFAVGSLINHLSDFKNPHKVSAAEIGAAGSSHLHSTNDINSGILGIARGGTGAGTAKEALAKLGAAPASLYHGAYVVNTEEELDSKLLSLVNAITSTSARRIYYFSITGIHCTLPSDHWHIEIAKYANHCGITATSFLYTSIVAHRLLTLDGILMPWEFDNPPMNLGVEYRTTERYKGKAVYTKLLNMGAMPNATSVTTSLGLSDCTVIDSCVVVNETGTVLPFEYEGNDSVGRGIYYISNTSITVTTTKNWSAKTFSVLLKYVKE